ncbi:unnamed protein product, partial [Brassica oleracea]
PLFELSHVAFASKNPEPSFHFRRHLHSHRRRTVTFSVSGGLILGLLVMSTDSEADFAVNASTFESGESDSESEGTGLDAESEECSQRSKLESLKKLSDSDLVWGKVSSFPWWPGQVFLNSSVASKKAKKHFKKGAFLVAYFGDCSFAWTDVSKIKPFRQHFSQMVEQSDSPEFHNAVGCALEEVSRRVEFGLSCGCVYQEAYDRVKTQSVMNAGIREESRVRYGGDEASSAGLFEPAKLVEYMKRLACCPRYDESDDKLLFVSNRARLFAFQQWTSCINFPRYETVLKDVSDAKREEETLSDCIAERSKSVGKKRKVESLESGKPEKKIKTVAEPSCFLMGAIPLRMESEVMTHTLNPLGGDSNSISKPDEMISSLKGTPKPLNLEHSNYEDFEKFIEETSCGNLSHDSEKASVPSDVKESSDQPESGSKVVQTGVKDCSADSLAAPNALILKFASSGSVPSAEKLNSIFNRYGPLREAETRVMKKGKKARVIFRRGEDAKTAFSSSGKYSIFGPSLLSYSLKYVAPPQAKENNDMYQSSGAAQVESHNKLAIGMNSTASAQLFEEHVDDGSYPSSLEPVVAEDVAWDNPTDSGSGDQTTITFGSFTVPVNTRGRSGFDKSMSEAGSSSNEEYEKKNDNEGFQVVGCPYEFNNFNLNAVNVYVDMQTTKFRDFETAKGLVEEIKSIVGGLPPAADGSKYMTNKITCYLSTDPYLPTDPHERETRNVLERLKVKMKRFALRKMFCRNCRGSQITPPRPGNLLPGQKPQLLEIEMVCDLLWHVLDLEDHRFELNKNLYEAKDGKVPKPFRDTVMLITGDQWLTNELESDCLDGFTLLKDIPACLEPIPMSISKNEYWKRRRELEVNI